MKPGAQGISILLGLVLLALLPSACNLPGREAGGTAPQDAGLTRSAPAFSLPEPARRFPTPPIVPIPNSQLQIGSEVFDAYQVPGDRFRLLCRQPCQFTDRMLFALYAGYKVTAQAVVRTAGLDVVDTVSVFDVHLDRDATCTRFEGEIGLTTSYPEDPDSIVLCLYLADADHPAAADALPSPEEVASRGGLGVFAHEYVHAILLGRFTSSHDYVYPVEYVTMDPSNAAYYGDLCESLYESSAPLSYQLCQQYGFSLDDLLQSLLDVDRLFEDGAGNLPNGVVGYAQYRAILENGLGLDAMQAFLDAGYQKIFTEEGGADYSLPYASEPCTYRARLLGDVTMPPGSLLDVNARFTKTWSIENAGTCAWEGVQLVHVQDEVMSEATRAAVPATGAGAVVEISIPMVAPAEAGVHVGEWRLRAPDGTEFGPIINLTLYTRPGCSVAPEISSFSAQPAAIGPGALSLLGWGQVSNADRVEIIGLGEVNPDGGRVLVQPDLTTTYTLQAACGDQTSAQQVTVMVDSSLPAFRILGVDAWADPAEYTGSCESGIPVLFAGSFVSSAPGVLVYRWNTEDADGQPELSIVEQAGEQSLGNGPEWRFWASRNSWMELEVLAPVEQDPLRVEFSLTCTP